MTIPLSVRSLALASAVAAALALPAPAAAADAFTGCLAQEEEPPNFYRLDGAMSGEESLGDLRLIGSISGVDPKEALGSEVRVHGSLSEAAGEEGAKKIRVRSVTVIGESCA